MFLAQRISHAADGIHGQFAVAQILRLDADDTPGRRCCCCCSFAIYDSTLRLVSSSLAFSLTMGVISELRRPGESGAYNAWTVLAVMVA